MRYYICTGMYPTDPGFKSTFHGLFTQQNKEFAASIGRELAYGPPQLAIDTEHYGDPILLWPLVIEENNAISR